MARITCRTPSTGRPLRIALADVPTTFENIAEAPDFSIPDPAGSIGAQFSVDPLDSTRAIRPGEIFFLSPLSARNKSNETKWIEVQLLTEDGITVNGGRINVPAGDTAYIPIQGRSLFKRDPSAANGDRLQIRAESSEVFDVWGAAEEKLSAEHIGTV